MKKCTKCGELKNLINFSKTKNGYYHSWCNKCRAEIEKIRRYEKFEEISNKAKIKYEENKDIYKLRRIKNRAKIKEYENNYYKKNKEKLRAKWKINWMIRNGKMLKQPCDICGLKAQAHHKDYSKPLDVIWLCAKHHKLRHTRG